jgi:hypothetical protein
MASRCRAVVYRAGRWLAADYPARITRARSARLDGNRLGDLGGRPAQRGSPGTDARSAGCLHQPGVLRGELSGQMAELLLAQRLAQHGQDGSGSSAGLFIG